MTDRKLQNANGTQWTMRRCVGNSGTALETPVDEVVVNFHSIQCGTRETLAYDTKIEQKVAK